MYIQNRYWRTLLVPKALWLSMIANKQATQILKPETSYSNITKKEVIELLKKAKIPFDEFMNKDELIKLLPN